MYGIRRLLVRTALFVAILFALAPVSAKPTATAPASTAVQPKKHAIGEHLMIEWGGSWWAATVLTVIPDGRAVIHYDGWGSEWDELVAKPSRIRTELPAQTTYAAFDAVFVEWKGSWWPAKVQKVTAKGFAIRYDGYGSEWDEVVDATRIKRFGPPEG